MASSFPQPTLLTVIQWSPVTFIIWTKFFFGVPTFWPPSGQKIDGAWNPSICGHCFANSAWAWFICSSLNHSPSFLIVFTSDAMFFPKLAGLTGKSPVLRCFGPVDDKTTMPSSHSFELVAVGCGEDSEWDLLSFTLLCVITVGHSITLDIPSSCRTLVLWGRSWQYGTLEFRGWLLSTFNSVARWWLSISATLKYQKAWLCNLSLKNFATVVWLQ